MPKVDLKQNYRYTNGRLYRAGKEVEVPEGFEAWRTGGTKAATSSAGSGEGGAETFPYADVLAPAGFRTWAQVQDASDEALLDVDGIGPKRLGEIRAWKPAA